ncbi:hypothetical protein [Dactylosporangium sp. CA-139066]|uniref:hypothetical protein n=1 Tax=Dactylosporangium sp. CA-139066 TaxID=3239930 RepID=UPI003D94E4C3
MARVLVTGMSGAGKSTLIAELTRRGATIELDGRHPVPARADAVERRTCRRRRRR